MGRLKTALVLLVCFAAAGSSAFSADAPGAKKPPVAVPTPKPPAITDRHDLETFFDVVMHEQLEFKHVAGAVVAVVAGDQVVFSKGYGFADVDARKPVDPETTQFRIASVSKLFVWTAVMQLVEQGKLDLDADLNRYLKSVQIPATYPQPVTLKHLLTHAPGFEDSVIGLFAHRAEEVKPLEEVLRVQMPARVRPPGELASYSNHGTALAALAMANVSGKPFEEVVEKQIFEPLGMKHTFARQPATDKLPATLSKGYRWKGGKFVAEPFEYLPAAPAGAISASAGDMTHFLLAHLHDGEFGKSRILKTETAKRMREPLFTHDPKCDAMCYGFWELHRNGQRILHHGGDTVQFHTLFAMIPERGVGLFVSFNTDRGATARDEMMNLFLDRYFPNPELNWPKPSADPGDLKRFAGEYTNTRHSYTTYAKMASLLGGFRIVANSDGTLTAGTEPMSKRYVPVEPMVFQELYGPRRMVFRADESGHVTHLFFPEVPAASLLRRGYFETSQFHWGLVVTCAAIFATALIFWPTIAFCTRRLVTPFRKSGGSAVLSVLGWLMCLICLLFMTGMMIGIQDPEEIAFGTPPRLRFLLLVPQVCAGLAAITPVASIIAWGKRYWRFSGRLHYTLVALSGVAFVWFLHYWNLLTFGATV